jgi:membrane-anchored glycerophosphoryl diester phosphodiesterase (GDPDase)
MQKFDMSAAWSDARVLLSSYGGLVWTVAGVFLFLPQFVMGLSIGAPPQVPETATMAEWLAAWQPWFQQMLPYQIVGGIFVLIGTLAILRLWLTRSSLSVAEAIKGALLLLVPVFFAQLLTGIVTGLGFLLLVIPGIYLAVRFSLVGPVAADHRARGVGGIISASWAITKGHVWPLTLYYFLVMVALIVIYTIIAMVLGGIAAFIPGIGVTLGVMIDAALTTIFTVVFLAISTAVYRQLVSLESVGVAGR